LLILAKLSGMSWSTVKAIITCATTCSAWTAQLEASRQTYDGTMRPEPAQQVLRLPPHAADAVAGGVAWPSERPRGRFLLGLNYRCLR